MMSPDTQQVYILSDCFHYMANSLGDYIDLNNASLSDAQRNNLYDSQVSLYQQSSDINALGVAMVFDDVQQSVQQLSEITASLKESVKKTLAVQNAVNIATSLVQLANAIISRSPKEIGAKTVDVYKAIRKN